MKLRLRSIAAASIFGALLCVAPPAVADTVCPASVSVEEHAAQPPEGWSARDSGIHPNLIGVTIYDGPLEENASLVYDDEKKTSREITQTWNLTRSDRGYWLVCRYSDTRVELMRRLPDSAKHCHVVFERDKTSPDGLGSVKTASCVE